jgi:adenine-specific DNA-methyltransferase
MLRSMYKLYDHLIFVGDTLNWLRKIPDESVNLIFVDPPYNIGKDFGQCKDRWKSEPDYLEWCYQWIDLCLQKLAPNGSVYLMAATQYMPFFDIYIRNKIHILSRIVWCYDSSGRQAKKYFGSLHEPLLHCVRDPQNYVFNSHAIQVEAKTGAQRKLVDYRSKTPRLYNTTKVPGNVWNFPRVRYKMPEYRPHPSQKPEALLERIILASSHTGDRILDPFAGTFTTASVCARLGRRSISIEQEESYVEIGKKRLTESLSSTSEHAYLVHRWKG